jgi:uncharacterized protein (TIGR03435 family)
MRRFFPALAIFSSVVVSVLGPLNGFSQALPPARIEFDTASVKPSASTRLLRTMLRDGKLTTTGITLKTLVALAYDVREAEVSGGPEWVASERFDINAKSGPANATDLKQMVRSLLEDRFQLRTHREAKQMPVYGLIADKRGPAMKPSSDLNCTDPASGYSPPPQLPAPGQPLKPATIRCGNFYVLNDRLQGRKVTLQQLASTLSSMNLVDQRVIDQTGIAGSFDIDLQWDPSERTNNIASDAKNLPSILQAFQEQLGLKLQTQRAPVEVLVIDNAARPTAN